jgi:hypothetical protein
MKRILLWALLLVPGISLGTAFEDDPTSFYVSGAGANEALEIVNEIICFMNNTRGEEFVNDGFFKATIYADDCTVTSESSASAESAKPKSSDATSSSDTAETAEQKIASTAILNVTRADEESPVLITGWFELNQEEEIDQGQVFSQKIIVYMDMVQRSGVSEESPRGIWAMRYSLEAGEDLVFGPDYILPKGTPLGIGYIDSAGTALRFKEIGANSTGNLIANFSDNGDVEGIFQDTYYLEEDGLITPVFVLNSFGIDEANKVYCSQYLSANLIDFNFVDGARYEPVRTPYEPTGEEVQWDGGRLTEDETCYSTDVTKAYRHVWRYGVYDADGERYQLSNQAFPLKAKINEGLENEQEVFAYAGYWGVHVNSNSIDLVDDTLTFEQENFAGDADAQAPTFTLKTKNLRLEKRSKEYVSLNSLSGITLGVNMSNDTYWSTELANVDPALADNSEYEEYEGSFDAETQTFTFTEGVTFYPFYDKETLATPFSFTVADWLTNMKKVVGAGEDWEFTEYATLHVYSHDTQQGYAIDVNAFNNPTDGSAPDSEEDTSHGVGSEVTEVVRDLTEIAGGLKCLIDCPQATLLKATFTDALDKIAQAQGGEIASASPSPYSAAGPLVTEAKTVTINYCGEGVDDPGCQVERTYDVGEWVDGLLAEEITEYTLVDGVIQEDGEVLQTGVDARIRELMADDTIDDPYKYFQGAYFETLDNGGTFRNDIAYGVRSGPLVLASDLPKLECTKNQDTGEYEGDTPPEFTEAQATQTRYCASGLWNDKVATTYQIAVETQPAFEIFDSGGNPVAFDPPKMLYFSVPDEAAYGEDAGKNLRLEYSGFGQLYGIPGEVVNINTGEKLGQYFDGEWKDFYRYLSRFLIPEGGELTDNVSGLSYKVKPLNGEEYLSLAPESKGNLTYASDAADLIADDLMIDVGPNGGENSIGEKPADSQIINGGEPSVVHGEILFDPTPSTP